MKNTYSCLNVAELEEFGGHIVAGNEWKCRIIREKMGTLDATNRKDVMLF